MEENQNWKTTGVTETANSTFSVTECGVAIGKGQTLIVHGSNANIGDFPWHAGIYDKEQKTGITQVCGGTLVLPNLIVSGAY